MLTKPYPKDNEPRAMGLPADLVAQLTDSITTRHLGPDDLLFATRDGSPAGRTCLSAGEFGQPISAVGGAGRHHSERFARPRLQARRMAGRHRAPRREGSSARTRHT